LYGGQATQQMLYPSCGGSSTSVFPEGKQLGNFFNSMDIIRSEFLKTAQKGRKDYHCFPEPFAMLFMQL
jgi:hypothetical protein